MPTGVPTLISLVPAAFCHELEDSHSCMGSWNFITSLMPHAVSRELEREESGGFEGPSGMGPFI